MRFNRSLPRSTTLFATLLPILLAGAAAQAAGSDADKCEAAKLKGSGKYASCYLSSLAKTTQGGEAADGVALASCFDKFEASSGKAEDKSSGACPTSGDSSSIAASLASCASGVAADLSGSRFVDNGDGTVRDVAQGVTWQKTTAGTGSSSSADQLRTIGDILPWLGTLNGSSVEGGLGGNSDWSLPTLAQLQSLYDCSSPPCQLVSAALGAAPMPSAGGSTYVISGETGTLPMSTVPCFKVMKLEDGSVECQDGPSVNGSSRARIMNNAR